MVPCIPTDGNSGHEFTLVSIDTMVQLAAFLRGRIIFACQNQCSLSPNLAQHRRLLR